MIHSVEIIPSHLLKYGIVRLGYTWLCKAHGHRLNPWWRVERVRGERWEVCVQLSWRLLDLVTIARVVHRLCFRRIYSRSSLASIGKYFYYIVTITSQEHVYWPLNTIEVSSPRDRRQRRIHRESWLNECLVLDRKETSETMYKSDQSTIRRKMSQHHVDITLFTGASGSTNRPIEAGESAAERRMQWVSITIFIV